MSEGEDRARFLTQVKKSCRIGRKLRDLGIRRYGVIRIDSSVSPAEWSKDPDANTALFEVINRRYLKSSTILTSHAGVASWGERLADPMLAAALLDRLLHRGIVVAIDGPSFRMRAHQQRSDQLRRALAHRDQP